MSLQLTPLSLGPPPSYVSAPVNPVPKHIFPTIPGAYRHPGLSKAKIQELDVYKKRQIDLAFEFLANLDLSKRKMEKKATYISNNSVANLFSYLCCNKLDIIKRAFGCCCYTKDFSYTPIPSDASETLELTREQFDRNTLGVCCIAPAVIVATPFIPASPAIATLLGIFSGLVITTTAGTNTYVFSGDIGVVPNGRGDLCVQGGIRVDAITQIENAYNQMALRLTEKWKSANDSHDENTKVAISNQCKKILKNWDFMFEEIANCGLKTLAVENILANFAESLGSILREIEPEGPEGIV